MQNAHDTLNTDDTGMLRDGVLLSFAPVSLVIMLGSHPWTAEDQTAINIINEQGQNLAHLCAQLGYNQLFLTVIQWGVDISAKDINGWTPLDLARLNKDKEAVDVLEGDWVDPVEHALHSHSDDMSHNPIVSSSIRKMDSGDLKFKSTVPSSSLTDESPTFLGAEVSIINAS
jgi:hypothetical protein